MSSVEYYKLIEDLKDRQFCFMLGGRNVSKIDFYAKYLCCKLKYFLGGFVEYKKYNKYIEIIVKNDDIGSPWSFTLFNDTICYEKHDVIFVRILEDYDAIMRYRYRDYIKEKEANDENK